MRRAASDVRIVMRGWWSFNVSVR